MDINETLNARGARYGTFADNAKLAQALKATMRATDGWRGLDLDQMEALDMIASKISRMLTGDPNYADNWVDLSGYAKLIADRLNG